MKQLKKDNWIDEVIVAGDSIRRVAAPEGLFNKIERKLSTVPVVRAIPLRTVSLAAASILLLLAINILAASGYKQKHAEQSDKVQAIAEYYGLTDNYGI